MRQGLRHIAREGAVVPREGVAARVSVDEDCENRHAFGLFFRLFRIVHHIDDAIAEGEH
jgi:hypothetical protein